MLYTFHFCTLGSDMKKVLLGILIVIVALAVTLYIDPQINPSHDTPYVELVNESQAPGPTEEAILQRVLLYGDAGHSTIDPWQASLAKVAKRAGISPEKSAVVALGDNIYFMGYPNKDDDQEEFDKDQLKSISYLDAQLKVAQVSGAPLYLVPGNHDWLASQMDGQGEHIAAYAKEHKADVSLRPWALGKDPLPSSIDRDGVSLIFLDSEWMMHTSDENYDAAFKTLDDEIKRIRAAHPDNLIVVTAHHPMETMGQHAGYLTHFGYWFFIKIIYSIFDVDQDVDHPNYMRFIDRLKTTFAPYDKIIFAAGHEHSLQVFGSADGTAPEYTLVSGAANTGKVSGVWHTPNTRFALSREGFMELAVTADGVHISIHDTLQDDPVSQFWLTL